MAQTLGIALSGGGVRGLAHISVLEAVDAAGIRPSAIVGTSMGAVLGALYASGLSGAQIRDLIEQHVITRWDGLRQVLQKGQKLIHWATFFRPEWTRRGLLRADRFLSYVLSHIEAECFEELQTPLSVVAVDYHQGTRVVLKEGRLQPAIRASMSIPGVFSPILHEGKTLIDGGIADNLSYDLLHDVCSEILVSDSFSPRSVTPETSPTTMGALQRGFEILMRELGERKLAEDPPSFRVCSELPGIHALDFHRIGDVLEASSTDLADLTRWLSHLDVSDRHNVMA